MAGGLRGVAARNTRPSGDKKKVLRDGLWFGLRSRLGSDLERSKRQTPVTQTPNGGRADGSGRVDSELQVRHAPWMSAPRWLLWQDYFCTYVPRDLDTVINIATQTAAARVRAFLSVCSNTQGRSFVRNYIVVTAAAVLLSTRVVLSTSLSARVK